MITPPLLNRGDTIGIIAPARKISEMELARFMSWAEDSGYNVRKGKNLSGQYNQFSGSDKQRLDDLEDMIKDHEVKAIIAARGGYGCGRLLEDLNINLLTEHPKWIAGFSDVTALLMAFNKIADVETLHTWMPYSLYTFDDFDRESINSLNEVLTTGRKQYVIKPETGSTLGMVRGTLTGGNLSVISSLAGTPYEPDYEGNILLLEDVDEYLYHVDRMILNLEMRGVFNRIAGLMIGAFSQMQDNETPFGKQAYEIIAERAYKYNVPVLFGVPSGHENSNHTLIFGRNVTLTIKEFEATLII